MSANNNKTAAPTPAFFYALAPALAPTKEDSSANLTPLRPSQSTAPSASPRPTSPPSKSANPTLRPLRPSPSPSAGPSTSSRPTSSFRPSAVLSLSGPPSAVPSVSDEPSLVPTTFQSDEYQPGPDSLIDIEMGRLVAILFWISFVCICACCYPWCHKIITARVGNNNSGSGSNNSNANNNAPTSADEGRLARSAAMPWLLMWERNEILKTISQAWLVVVEDLEDTTTEEESVFVVDDSSPATHTASKKDIYEEENNVEDEDGGDNDPQNDDSKRSTAAVCCICLAELSTPKKGELQQQQEEEEAVVQSPTCTHRFHHSCCLEWLTQNACCPYCRAEMISPTEFRIAAAATLTQSRMSQFPPFEPSTAL